MNEIENWIVEYFRAKARLNGAAGDELLDVNYFDAGMLDSLGTLEMITGLEDQFEVRFEPEQMQDPRFCSIRGLAEIVGEMRANGG